MQLMKLIDILAAIERRHSGESVTVEVRDASGFLSGDFDVVTEYILPARRITVRFDSDRESESPSENGDNQ